MDEDTSCRVCKIRNQVMKRCTKCHVVYYCSRECQVADWKTHRQNCNKTGGTDKTDDKYCKDDGSIFTETKPQGKITVQHRPIIDFQKASKDIQKMKTSQKSVESRNLDLAYLHGNQYFYDLPVLDENQPFSEILVKCNKEKQKMKIQNSWTGEEIFKVLCNKLKIPLEKIKIINKGRIMTQDTVQSSISNKAIFQVIGEQAANEDGLNISDVDLLMKQMSVDRNDAVMALCKNGDIVDAIIELGQK